ncbi:MAG: hypothetical protein HQL35_01835 [Alphaproteobacteria bacterium]|nr:hypothetical protein [Alphaproteobacteria bacterium]
MKTGLAVLAVSLALAETFSAISVEAGLISAPSPNYRMPGLTPFWSDISPEFGVWHPPESRYVHTTGCFNVTYDANAHGMRDRAREVHAPSPRTVVLGDSFVEGFGLKVEHRFTDILEARTGIEHLNFGTSGTFGLVQQVLLYETLASKFDHDRVIWAVLPNNDFEDDSPTFGAVAHSKRYRPYAVADGHGGFMIEYHDPAYLNADTQSDKEKRKQRRRAFRQFLTNFTYTANVVRYITALLNYREAQTRGKDMGGAQLSGGSAYWDFTDVRLSRMLWALGRGIDGAGERPVDIVVIPVEGDIERFAREGGPAPLSRHLTAFAETRPNVRLIDMLEPFAAHPDWRSLYHACDDHWSPAGAAFVADLLEKRIYEAAQ